MPADPTTYQKLVEDGRKLLEGVPRGPWRALLNSRGMTGVHSEADGGCKLYHVTLAEGSHPDTHARQKAVAVFIADARTRMPAALDEIERLAGENERLRERLAMATAFDAGGGVSIERCGSGWIAKRTVQPRGNRHLNEYLDRDGNWRRDEVTQFNTAEEVSAALDRARGGSR